MLLQFGENCIKNLMHAREIELFEDSPGSMRTQILCQDNTIKIISGKTYITTSTESPNYGIRTQRDIKLVLSQTPEVFIGGHPVLMEIFTMFADIEDSIPEKGTTDFINTELDQIFSQLVQEKNIFKGSDFEKSLKFALTKNYLYGSNIVDARANASLLLTEDGLFRLTDEFMEYLSRNAQLQIKPKKLFKSTYGRKEKNSKLPKTIEKYKAIVEQVKEKMVMKEPSKEEVLVSLPSIILTSLVEYFDFDFSVSVNPIQTASNKERKSNEFNTVVVKGKEVRIPVTLDKGDMFTNTIKEDIDLACDILVERNMMSKFVANGVKGTKNKSDIPEELKMLIATVLSDTKNNRKISIIEKLEGYEKKYSKKTSHHRSNRNKARRAAEKKFGAAAIKGKDVDHKDGNPMNNSPSNLRLRSKGDNRSDNGHHKGEPHKKAMRGITNTFKGKGK
jgi:hypothetical protein